jgi:hypothetical protein
MSVRVVSQRARRRLTLSTARPELVHHIIAEGHEVGHLDWDRAAFYIELEAAPRSLAVDAVFPSSAMSNAIASYRGVPPVAPYGDEQALSRIKIASTTMDRLSSGIAAIIRANFSWRARASSLAVSRPCLVSRIKTARPSKRSELR